MSKDQLTFQNENVTVSLFQEPNCQVKLEVFVSPKAVQACRQKAIKNVNKEVSLPGFRKGKVPDDLIIKKFAKPIESEWKNLLLNTGFNEALHLTEIYPLDKKNLRKAFLKSLSESEGAVLIFEYESSPDIPSIVLQDLTIPAVQRRSIEEDDIAKALANLCLQKAEWTDVTDRPVQEGDFVVIDVDAIEKTDTADADADNKPVRNICSNTLISIAEGKVEAWMRKLLIGMNIGQVLEGMSEKDETQKWSNLQAFVPTLYRITLHKIKQANIPPLDDELAIKYGAKSLDELKKRLIANLNKSADQEQRKEVQRQVKELLLEKYRFELPLSLVQDRLNSIKKELAESLQKNGIEEAKILYQIKSSEQELLKEIDKGYRLYFLINIIARDHQLEISREEVLQEFKNRALLQQMGMAEGIDLEQNPKQVYERLDYELLMSKTIDFLIDHSAHR